MSLGPLTAPEIEHLRPFLDGRERTTEDVRLRSNIKAETAKDILKRARECGLLVSQTLIRREGRITIWRASESVLKAAGRKCEEAKQ